jgi:hypothetical protein
MSRAQPNFDRLRPRSTLVVNAPPSPPLSAVSERPPATSPVPASEGRRALFSVDEPGEAAFGSVSIECSGCHETSVLAMRQAMRLAVPSLYLPVLRGRYPAWLHCPACSGWTWNRVRVRL